MLIFIFNHLVTTASGILNESQSVCCCRRAVAPAACSARYSQTCRSSLWCSCV